MNRHGMANSIKSAYTKAAHCSNHQISTMIPLPILKNLTIIPVSKVPQDSSKLTSLNKKETEPVSCQSKERFILSNFKNAYETSIGVTKLKKLPDITFDVVNPKPVFKVPKMPTLNLKKNSTPNNKSKTIIKRKVLSERRDDNIIIDKNISKNPEESSKKYSCSGVENNNTWRPSYPSKIPEKTQTQSFPNIKSKNLKKPAKDISSTSNISQEVITSSDNDSILENKTHELDNEDYLLMDLSNEGQININLASRPLDFINGNLPEYDRFVMEISESSEIRNTQLETPQNYIEKRDLNDGILIQSPHEDDNMNQTTVTSKTVLKDNQEMRSFFCDNLFEKTSENETELMECNLSNEILSNSTQSSLDVKSVDKTNGIKRLQPQNGFYKKQKSDDKKI